MRPCVKWQLVREHALHFCYVSGSLLTLIICGWWLQRDQPAQTEKRDMEWRGIEEAAEQNRHHHAVQLQVGPRVEPSSRDAAASPLAIGSGLGVGGRCHPSPPPICPPLSSPCLPTVTGWRSLRELDLQWHTSDDWRRDRYQQRLRDPLVYMLMWRLQCCECLEVWSRHWAQFRLRPVGLRNVNC